MQLEIKWTDESLGSKAKVNLTTFFGKALASIPCEQMLHYRDVNWRTKSNCFSHASSHWSISIYLFRAHLQRFDKSVQFPSVGHERSCGEVGQWMLLISVSSSVCRVLVQRKKSFRRRLFLFFFFRKMDVVNIWPASFSRIVLQITNPLPPSPWFMVLARRSLMAGKNLITYSYLMERELVI